MKKVGIVGYGYVGKAMHRFFADKYDVAIYDPAAPESVKTVSDLAVCDLVVVSVPTPMAADGACDTSAVEQTLEMIGPKTLVLVKSTVPPSFTQTYIDHGYRVVFSPEYLGESSYVTHHWKGYPDPTNLKTHEFQIFGGDYEETCEVIGFFKNIMGPETKYLQTDATTAEMAKYMENAFFATKVTFCNEFYEIAKAFGVDYNELRELWLNDGRINRNHTLVFEDKRGYGGKCYPKDVSAIIKASEEAGHKPMLLKAVQAQNEFFKATQDL
jgi:UDPglucose 6-dehydrogenase